MNDDKGAGVRVPPPLIFISFMLLAVAIELCLPLNMILPRLIVVLGLGLILAGVATLLYLAIQFRRVKTNIEPWKPTSSIITSGLYAYSRNPIYLAFCTVTIGLGLFFSHIWLLLSALPSCILVYYLAILPEERYLTAKFGDEYREYLQRVRRWI